MVTKSSFAKGKFVPGTSRSTRDLRRLALQMAEELKRDIERGDRIRALVGAKKQEPIARACGVGVRSLQNWMAGTGMTQGNLERLADYFGVSTDYIEYGDDVVKPHAISRIESIEAKLDEVLRLLTPLPKPGGALGSLPSDDDPSPPDPPPEEPPEGPDSGPGIRR